jgi:signal transduction histidine kinase/ActR/RegA family two-component response regulator
MVGLGLVPFALSAGLTACCALVVRRRRAQPGAMAFAGLLLAETVYSAGYVGELAAGDLESKVFWDNLQLLAMIAILPGLLSFVWDYAERGPARRGLFWAWYMLCPLLTVLWVLGDPLGSARASARIEHAPPFGTLLYDFTVLEWLLTGQVVATVGYAVAVLSRMVVGLHRALRSQVILIIFGVAAPTLASMLGLLGLRFLGQRDIAPAFFGLAALPITWALHRRRFLDLAPVARHVVFARLPDPAFVLDAMDRVIDLNPCAQTLLGASQKPLGKSLHELLAVPAAQTLNTMQSGSTVELQIGERWFDARSELLEMTREQVRGRVILLRETTERKAAELALQSAHEALEQRVAERTRELHTANEAMKREIAERELAEQATRTAEREQALLKDELHHTQKLDSIGQLAGGIAHDFNNLLTVILGQIELSMMSYRRGKDPCDGLEQAAQAAHSASKLTHQLLAFARKQPVSPKVLALNGVIEQTHRMLSRLIGENVTLDLRLGRNLRQVRIDPGQLEQVLVNLAVNARDAMPNGGVLTIATENIALQPAQLAAKHLSPEHIQFVRARIYDTGHGMSPDVMARIFEPFFTTKAPGQGTGIGLATVYGVIKQAGGFVDVLSKEGVGTTFDLYFPSTEASLEAPRQVLSDNVPAGNECVALVEDQPALRELVSDQLSRLGYRVVSFPRAEDALADHGFSVSEIDLLVTDVLLTGMTGPALVDRLRQSRADLRVLYMSGYSSDEVFARGVDAASSALLYKPFSIKDLAQAMRRVIEAPS